MATIAPTVTRLGNADQFVFALAAGDDGQVVEVKDFSDICIQVSGALGGATLTFEGSNDGSNWFTLNDLQGTAISKTSAFLEQVAEAPRYVRVKSTGGSGGSMSAILLIRRARNWV